MFKYLTVIFGSLIFSYKSYSQKIILACGDDIRSLDISSGTCITQSIFANGASANLPGYAYSIALYKDTVYYDDAGTGNLYQFVLNSQSPPKLLMSQDFSNALTVDKDGNLFYLGVNDSLEKYDPHSNTIKTIGPLNYSSAGDLVFYKGKLYLASNESFVEVNVDNPGQSTVYMSTPGRSFIGLLNISTGCNQNTIFGIEYSLTGNGFNLVEIDMANKTILGTYCNIPYDVLDAGSITEDGNNEGVTIDSILRPFCAKGLMSTSIQVFAKTASNSSLTYTLNNVDSNTSGKFTNLVNGNYFLSVKTKYGCFADTTIHINLDAAIPVNITVRDATCDSVNGSVNINRSGETSTLSYYFNSDTITTRSFFSPLDTGVYFIRIKDTNYCTVDTSVTIKSGKSDYVVNLGNDTTVCNGQSLLLDATNQASDYLWQDGSTKSVYKVTKSGVYTVRVNNLCGTGSGSIKVIYQDCDCMFYVPNAFTPNNDGRNDIFKPFNKCYFEKYQLRIFNRWGNEVFNSINQYAGWDGISNNSKQPAGVYVWELEYFDGFQNRKIMQHGVVNLIR